MVKPYLQTALLPTIALLCVSVQSQAVGLVSKLCPYGTLSWFCQVVFV